MIVIGASLGGSRALQIILGGLPGAFPLPLAVVLHRHREADDSLVRALQPHSPFPVSEALDKEPIDPGRLYLAPPDYHLLVEPAHFSLSTDEPVNFARPSIDVLFESAADAFGAELVGVVLSGASRDGADGVAAIRRQGGTVIVQDPETAECKTMPAAALEATGSDCLRPLDQIATTLIQVAEARLRRIP
jgi:two-component system, chemotaxis family, protein-glutamate methylesterase/glutaminase